MLDNKVQSDIEKFMAVGEDGIILPDSQRTEKFREENVDISFQSIDDRIATKNIETSYIQTVDGIKIPNYTLDFRSGTESAKVIKNVMRTLECRVDEKKDTAVYALIKDELIELFVSNGEKLSRLLTLYKQSVLDSEVKVYKDYHGEENPNELKTRDFSKIRLSL